MIPTLLIGKRPGRYVPREPILPTRRPEASLKPRAPVLVEARTGRRGPPRRRVLQQCGVCGADFEMLPSRAAKQRTRSRKCGAEMRSARIEDEKRAATIGA